MSVRQTGGKETWVRLKDWDRGSPPPERLAALILKVEGFRSIDPSHPLGGRDGMKDIVCERDGKKWIGAVYFPRGQQEFNTIAKKFKDDFQGVATNQVDGIAFITNQELTLGEREKLKEISNSTAEVEIFHLERIAGIINQPTCYGIRLDFLDIEMTKEEQISFIAEMQERTGRLEIEREVMLNLIQTSEALAKQLVINLEDKSKAQQRGRSVNITRAIPLVSNNHLLKFDNAAQDVHKCSQCGFGMIFTLNEPFPSISYPSVFSRYVGVICSKCNNADKIPVSFRL